MVLPLLIDDRRLSTNYYSYLLHFKGGVNQVIFIPFIAPAVLPRTFVNKYTG
jgi:hypothetical protein